MLLLDRFVGQTIVVTSSTSAESCISITLISDKRGRVKFGISAPRSLLVDRLEIFNRKRAEVGKPELDLDQIEEQNHRS